MLCDVFAHSHSVQSTYTSYSTAILNWISLCPVTADSQSAVVLCHTYDYLQIFCQLNESKLWIPLTHNYRFWVNCQMGKVCHLRLCSSACTGMCVYIHQFYTWNCVNGCTWKMSNRVSYFSIQWIQSKVRHIRTQRAAQTKRNISHTHAKLSHTNNCDRNTVEWQHHRRRHFKTIPFCSRTEVHSVGISCVRIQSQTDDAIDLTLKPITKNIWCIF